MLTRLTEKRTTKCSSYFPEQPGTAFSYGSYSVALAECVADGPDIFRRVMSLRDNETGEVRGIVHYQYHQVRGDAHAAL